MPFEHQLEIALKTARGAGDLALRYFESKIGSDEKSDASPVTIADRECEQYICRALDECFPEDGIVGEEGARKPSRSGARWIVDPIDGTRDFVRRTPFWAIQIALEIGTKIVLGLIYLPRLNEMFHALSGAGCYWDDSRTLASGIDTIEKAILMISGFRSVREKMPPEQVRFLTENCWTVRGYSGCYDVTMIARGKADIWLSGSGMEWDYAPARVIAEECGARFFTMTGGDRIDQDHCIICAPALETDLRRILRIPS